MSTKGWSFLLVDDDNSYRTMLAKLLTTHFSGSLFFHAENGRDAIKLIEKEKIVPDICIIDYDMPQMNGSQTAGWLRKWENARGESIILILHSAQTLSFFSKEEHQEIQNLFTAVLAKPQRTQKLVNDIKELLQSSETRR